MLKIQAKSHLNLEDTLLLSPSLPLSLIYCFPEANCCPVIFT